MTHKGATTCISTVKQEVLQINHLSNLLSQSVNILVIWSDKSNESTTCMCQFDICPSRIFSRQDTFVAKQQLNLPLRCYGTVRGTFTQKIPEK